MQKGGVRHVVQICEAPLTFAKNGVLEHVQNSLIATPDAAPWLSNLNVIALHSLTFNGNRTIIGRNEAII